MGLLHFAGFDEPCVVKNLSAGGLSARVYGHVAPGEPVRVELRRGEWLSGRVVWSRGYEVGICFAEPVDVSALTASRWIEEGGRRPRMPRVEIECPARIRLGSRSYLGKLVDISHGGAKIRTDGGVLERGDAVLTLPDLPHLNATVRWAEAALVGLAFNSPLAFQALASWVRGRRGGQAASAGDRGSIVREYAHG